MIFVTLKNGLKIRPDKVVAIQEASARSETNSYIYMESGQNFYADETQEELELLLIEATEGVSMAEYIEHLHRKKEAAK